jgi:hypothetical protein
LTALRLQLEDVKVVNPTFKNGRNNMPMYITYAKYSHSGVKGMIDKPTDRTGAYY